MFRRELYVMQSPNWAKVHVRVCVLALSEGGEYGECEGRHAAKQQKTKDIACIV